MGHPENRKRYLKIANEVGELLAEKNQAYGDSFVRGCEVLRILYPSGVPVNSYPDMLSMIRVIDKLFRIATDRDALGESPWRDVSGYSMLSVDFHENRQGEFVNLLPKQADLDKPRKGADPRKPIDLREDTQRRLGEFTPEPWPSYPVDKPLPATAPEGPRYGTPTGFEVDLASSRDSMVLTKSVNHAICAECNHDHARAAVDVCRSCLYNVGPAEDGTPVFCGCPRTVAKPAPMLLVGCGACNVTGFRGKCPNCGLFVQEISGNKPVTRYTSTPGDTKAPLRGPGVFDNAHEHVVNADEVSVSRFEGQPE